MLTESTVRSKGFCLERLVSVGLDFCVKMNFVDLLFEITISIGICGLPTRKSTNFCYI